MGRAFTCAKEINKGREVSQKKLVGQDPFHYPTNLD